MHRVFAVWLVRPSAAAFGECRKELLPSTHSICAEKDTLDPAAEEDFEPWHQFGHQDVGEGKHEGVADHGVRGEVVPDVGNKKDSIGILRHCIS